MYMTCYIKYAISHTTILPPTRVSPAQFQLDPASRKNLCGSGPANNMSGQSLSNFWDAWGFLASNIDHFWRCLKICPWKKWDSTGIEEQNREESSVNGWKTLGSTTHEIVELHNLNRLGVCGGYSSKLWAAWSGTWSSTHGLRGTMFSHQTLKNGLKVVCQPTWSFLFKEKGK